MEDIKDFLRNHPAISISWIEHELSIPAGTVRLTSNRTIPTKYIESLEQLLSDYGYKNTSVQEPDIPTVSTNKTYVFHKGMIGNYEQNGKFKLFIDAKIPNETIVTVLQQ